MNLIKKLADWQQHNLLSVAQGEAILAYENKSRKPMFMFSLLSLAVFCIGLGIISLISANWQLISAPIKLFFDFAILLGIAYGIYDAHQKGRAILFEVLIVFYAALVIASIGLIAQIYQIQPDGYKAYFLWSLLVAPLLFYTQKLVLPIIWLPIFAASSIDLLTHIPLIARIVQAVGRSFPFAISIAGILALSFVYRLLAIHFRTRLSSLIKSMKFWLVFDIVVLVLLMDFGAGNTFGTGLFGRNYNDANNISIFVISLLVVGMVAFGYFSHRHNYSRLLTCVLTVLLGFSLIYVAIPNRQSFLDIWGFLVSMSSLGCLSAYALIKGQNKLLNLATALIALRIFIVYLQVFGSLLSTGIGLIISGFVFLAIIYIWRRLHIDNLIIVKESK